MLPARVSRARAVAAPSAERGFERLGPGTQAAIRRHCRAEVAPRGEGLGEMSGVGVLGDGVLVGFAGVT